MPDKTNMQTNKQTNKPIWSSLPFSGYSHFSKKKQRGQDFIIQKGHIYTKIKENRPTKGTILYP